MAFAYWNPAMRDQKRLLKPPTGKVDSVKVERVCGGNIDVAGKDVAATDWRITVGESPVDVSISEQGDWVGLDSMLSASKHKLRYRLHRARTRERLPSRDGQASMRPMP